MTRNPSRHKITQNVFFAGMLTAVAGFVDLVGYVSLYHVFSANMTGNTIAIATGVVEHDVGLALRRGFAIPMFVLGAIFSRVWVHVAGRRRMRAVAAGLFAVEALLLAALVVFGQEVMRNGKVELASTARYYVLVALPSFAMGLQNATLTHFGPLDMRTTHVTGNLAKFADAAARGLIWAVERIGAPRSNASSRAAAPWNEALQQDWFKDGLVLGGVWVTYLVGALAGAFGYARWELYSLLAPVAGLAALVGLDLAWPMLQLGGSRKAKPDIR